MPDHPFAAGLGVGQAGLGHVSLIDRGTLLDALDRAAEKQVVIISAPAGSGKTSLLRAWAGRQGQGRRVAFMSVRPGQLDAQPFWAALLEAIRAAVDADGNGDGDRDQDGPPSPVTPGAGSSAMVKKVLAELSASHDPFVLVIDDLHELGSDEAAGQLAELLTNLPQGVHAIVATRRDLPLRLHQLRLAGQLAEIRAEQLRFTGDETRSLLAAAGIAVPERVAAMLHQRTEGWAAGLRLAVLSLAGHPDPERFVAEFSGSDRTVAEYLMAEMLERQPPRVRNLLLRTCLLDRVNGELADLLTGAAGSERILLDLEDANAFVVSLDPARSWFRYHRMFSGLLRLELRRTLPAQIPELHRLAARWFAEHGQVADAIRHLQAPGDWAEAGRLLADNAVTLILDGQGATMAALLRSFPDEAGKELPDLALVYATAEMNQGRFGEADAHLRVARSHAATTPPERRRRLQTAIACMDLLSARLRGHFEGVFEQVDALASLAVGRSDAEIALSGDLRALALMNLGVTEAWSLRLADSEQHLLEGAALARDIGRPYVAVACLAHLGFACTGRSFAVARQRCEEAVALAARHGWEGEPVIAPALATLANTLIWTGDFDHAEQWLGRAKRATWSNSEPGLRLLVRLTCAMLEAARGRHDQALEEFAAAGQTQALMVGEHALTRRVIAWTVTAQARLGMTGEARAALAALSDRQGADGEIRNAAAVIALAEQDPAEARRELRRVLDGTATVLSYLTLVEAHLLDALACRDLGEERAAGEAVESALNLAEPDRLILPFAMTGAWELLKTLPLRNTAHRALIADVLDAVRHGAPLQPAPGPGEMLSASELRVLRYLPTNLSRPEIAGELSLSLNTVNTHIRRIYAKLGATDRSSAVQRGRQLRLLSVSRV